MSPKPDEIDSLHQPAKTFDNFDRLDLRGFASRFTRFLHTEHDLGDAGLVVSLNGPFGTGKSTFLEMWSRDLTERRTAGEPVPVAIMLNAWESDFCGDPFLSVVSAFDRALDNLPASDKESKSTKKAFKEAAKDVGWFLLGLGNSFNAKMLGIDAVKAGDLAVEKKEARQPQKPDLLKAYAERMAALAKLKKALRKCFGGSKLTAILMIDELDRCRPSFAIEYLETIKHVFDVQGLAFVLAVDKAQLRSSACALFGGDLNFDEYYRKFAMRQINLPTPPDEGWRKLITFYFKKYIHSDTEARPGRRTAGLAFDQFVKNITELRACFHLNPRQMEEAFRIAGHVTAEAKTGQQLHWGYAVGALLMSVLSVKRREVFEAIGSGTLSVSDLLALLKKELHSVKNLSWWVAVILSGYPLQRMSQVDLGRALNAANITNNADDPEAAVRALFNGFGQAWGHFDAGEGFAVIRSSIDGLKPFFEDAV